MGEVSFAPAFSEWQSPDSQCAYLGAPGTSPGLIILTRPVCFLACGSCHDARLGPGAPRARAILQTVTQEVTDPGLFAIGTPAHRGVVRGGL